MSAFEDALSVEGYIAMYASQHRTEQGIGCTCGFGVWSGDHVALMAYEAAKHHLRVGLRVAIGEAAERVCTCARLGDPNGQHAARCPSRQVEMALSTSPGGSSQ